MPRSPTLTRKLAQNVLVRVARNAAFAERVLDSTLSRQSLPDRDRALLTELVYGTLRHAGWLDTCLAQHTHKPLEALPLPVLCALRLGAYQLLCMRVPAHSAVHESVALVRRFGRLSGVVNAILRRLADAPPPPPLTSAPPQSLEELAGRGSHPLWLLEQIAARRGFDATCAWVGANNQPAPLSLRVNRRVGGRDTLVARLAEVGICAEAAPFGLPSALWVRRAGAVKRLPGFAEGAFTVQDSAATLLGHLAGVRPGDVVIDACAAPGGKATHLAELMDDRGLVLANDIHPGKVNLVAEAAARLGLHVVQTASVDASVSGALQEALACHGHTEADVVMLDAPCSGLGTLRRNPELRQRGPEGIAQLASLQRELLDRAAEVVRPGGLLLYAVCTVTDDECEAQVRDFLRRHPDYHLEPLESVPPGDTLGFTDAGLGAPGEVRTWTDLHGCDSFYAARLRRAAPRSEHTA